jgi:hydroxymethylpyrimidine/phosphomethylpyrimidine kinase
LLAAMMHTPPVALTIAGSDSGGGAGVQADLKTFAALGVFGTSAITAITAQNSLGVHRVVVLEPEMVVEQVRAVLEDLAPRAAKTGMLGSAAIIDAISALAAAHLLPPLVVDPVMVSSSGARLLDRDAEQAYLRSLIPLAHVVTPNLHEAGVLLGSPITSYEEQRDAARELARVGAAYTVVKGGHPTKGAEDYAVDVVYRGDVLVAELAAPRVATQNTHGSGCCFAAAIAAGLASGVDALEAIRHAKDFVHRAIEGGATWKLGSGPGPLDHFGWSRGVHI